jgi:hypothetical protein
MKPLIKLFLPALIFIVYISPATAQGNDYIITDKGDTIKGQLTGRRFKANGWEKAKKINLDSIKETYIAEDDILKRAIYNPINTKRVFMTVLENGKINLYVHNEVGPTAGVTYFTSMRALTPTIGAVSTPHWYVAKGIDTLESLDLSVSIISFKPSKKRMDVLAQLIADNKEIYDKFISEDKLTLRQVRNIIHLYNTGKPFEEKPPKKEQVDTSNDFNPNQN